MGHRSPVAAGADPGVGMAGFTARTGEPVDLGVVPYPALTLALDLGAAPLAVDDGEGRRQQGAVVVGIDASGVRGRGRAVDCLQVRLSPVAAYAVLGPAAGEAGGTVLSLADLWGRDAAWIQERLRAVRSWPDRFALVEAVLAERYAAGCRVDPEVAHVWRRMVTEPGDARVERLAAEVGWSRKRLWSRFRAQAGLTPKRATQLVRFDRAAHRLAAGQRAARVAAEGGYADQSHLHREALAFTGAPPTAVAAAPWLAVDDVAWATPRYLHGE